MPRSRKKPGQAPRKKRGKIASRRRGAELEDAILIAAYDVLLEHGYPGFTYEAVAERAGTSRPVLYRRWPERRELLLATLRKLYSSPAIAIPDTGDLRRDALELLRKADLGRARMLTLISVKLMDYFSETGTSFRELRAALHPPDRIGPCEQLVARAVARGELRDEPRSSRVLNLALDLYRHEVFMTLRPVPERVIVEIVDELWLPLLGVRSRASADGGAGRKGAPARGAERARRP